MPLSDFANADIEKVVAELTTDEAISLTAGVGFWHTHAIPRLGIPAIKVSDGPNGVRGNYFFMSTPAKCLPASTAMGATWDTKLIEKVGFELLAPEAKLRSVSLVLGPTCNIQRNPLGGRSFESFSEDPWLSGLIAAAYVKGLQAGGIGATVKHFVANDKEDDRLGYDSILSQRALREIYLMPFMLAEKYAQPWSYMTAYNRLNGTHVSENPLIIRNILRDEWKSDALIMSDWFGTFSIDLSINAGLDLEMPGTNKWRTLDLMNRSIVSRKITVRTIKERAAKVLETVKKCAQGAPEVIDGDGAERTVENEQDKALLRRVAGESIVLLKNKDSLLPLKPSGLKKVAIVGGNAKGTVLSGGGSAALKPSSFISPFDGLASVLTKAGVEITYSEGAKAYMTMPSLDYEIVTDAGEAGWIGSYYCHENDQSMVPLKSFLSTRLIDETRMFFSTDVPKELTRIWTMKLEGNLKPRTHDVNFEFGLMSAGRAKLYVNGKLVIDNWTRQTRGTSFFGVGSTEVKATLPLKANEKYSILVEYCNVRAPADGDEDEAVMDSNPAVRLGGTEVENEDESMAKAVQLAKEADVVIAIVGLNADWETEGYDRTTLALPGRTDELVKKVAAANPKTIVVTQSGSAITMPWVDDVSSIVHSWYLGNATGHAIADVLFGAINPGGKLSLTFPKRLEDVPSFAHFHSENGRVWYAEDLFVGYKHYHKVNLEPLFAFGYGLSYTTFLYEDLEVGDIVTSKGDISLTVSVKITNTGSVAGSEVVQLYVTNAVAQTPADSVTHAPLQLRAFSKVHNLAEGASEKVTLTLDKYAVSYWEERIGSWVADKGAYVIRVGPSSDNLPLETTVVLKKRFEWNGL